MYIKKNWYHSKPVIAKFYIPDKTSKNKMLSFSATHFFYQLIKFLENFTLKFVFIEIIQRVLLFKKNIYNEYIY